MTIAEEVCNIIKASANGEMQGRDLRENLNKDKWFWQKWSTPAFYSLMARLEDDGDVVVRIQTVKIHNRVDGVNEVQQWFYKVKV